MDTDGATTVATGDVDMAHWPEQTYQVQSRVDFPRMKQLFFKDEKWTVTGDGNFKGVFHLSKAGPDLEGAFTSDVAGVNDYRFPELYGSLRWTKTAFDVVERRLEVLRRRRPFHVRRSSRLAPACVRPTISTPP